MQLNGSQDLQANSGYEKEAMNFAKATERAPECPVTAYVRASAALQKAVISFFSCFQK